MQDLANIIEAAFERRAEINADNLEASTKSAILETIELLDKGTLKLAAKNNGSWEVNQWLKKAILLYFKIEKNQIIEAGDSLFFDKIPLKFSAQNKQQLIESGVRVVPGASIRKGAYIAPNTIIMPSFINIGAHIGEGTMVDTWATVGSCAQIGKQVHLSGGVGIGGVLEPLQSNPTIIEDNCFIGARSEVVEGVIVEAGSVLSMGVYIGSSTRIYDRETGVVTYGRIPAGSVVVPGNLPSADGAYSLYCAVIVKRVDEKTRSKVSINELLRGF